MTISAISMENKDISSIKGEISPLMQRVVGAIKAASAATGADFSYLLNKAAQESSFRPDAKAKTSSATGLYQFTEQTWLRMVKEYGGKHGLGILAEKVTLRNDGSASVKDGFLRRQILDLRKNPEVASVMAAEFSQENRDYLQTQIGGDIGKTELYLAHFLGANGAARFIAAARANPQTDAAMLMPEAASTNKSVFFQADGTPRSVAQIYDRFAAKIEGKGVTIPDDAPPEMLAAASDVLNNIPDLHLPPGAMTHWSKAEAISGAHPSLASSVAPESLYTIMLLSQRDKMNFAGIGAGSRQEAAARADKDSHNNAPAVIAA